jgi:hypothetical protein
MQLIFFILSTFSTSCIYLFWCDEESSFFIVKFRVNLVSKPGPSQTGKSKISCSGPCLPVWHFNCVYTAYHTCFVIITKHRNRSPTPARAGCSSWPFLDTRRVCPWALGQLDVLRGGPGGSKHSDREFRACLDCGNFNFF